MNGSNKTHWFALDNEQALAQLKEDFWDVFLANLRRAVESGALSEEDTQERTMTVSRCVLVITGESMVPRSDSGKKMLANLRHFV
jgi:hypothetical protein